MNRTLNLLLISALSLSPIAVCYGEEDRQPFMWDVAGFVSSFSNKDWESVNKHISHSTKVGFGGGMGVEGLKTELKYNPECFNDMVVALKQGCKYISNNSNLECISPPQFSDKNVIYLGARASFIYNPVEKKTFVNFLICGGD